MRFVRVLCKEYHVKADELNRIVGLVNLVDSLDHIYDKMPKLLEQYEWWPSDIANKKYKILVHTVTFNIIVFNQQK